MKSVLIIGMGNFGQLLGEHLLKMSDEVMIVDRDEDTINMLSSKYTDAIVANCMNIESLQALDIPSFDVCVVAMGDDFQASLEITSNLKDLQAKYIVARAETDIQRKFLLRVGAHEVVYPNRDIAEKLAVKLNTERAYDYFELDDRYSIFEIAVPSKWFQKTLLAVNPRAHGLNILTIKKGSTVLPPPSANYVFAEGDHMVVFGNTEQIVKFANKSK